MTMLENTECQRALHITNMKVAKLEALIRPLLPPERSPLFICGSGCKELHLESGTCPGCLEPLVILRGVFDKDGRWHRA